MAFRVRPVRHTEEFVAAMGAIGHYFGWAPTSEDADRFSKLLPYERMHAAFEDGRLVSAAAVFPFAMTVPGGAAQCAGVSFVGVLPSHRRRGLLSRMMAAQLRDIRERDEPIAALWASEETIYGRYGYGLASLGLHIDAERDAVAIRPELSREGFARLVEHDEALRVFPRLYDRVARKRAGMIVRTSDWWETRKLDDAPDRRRGGGPLARVLLERDGRPVGYALYRLVQSGSTPADWQKTVRVLEAFGIDRAATRDIWRFLLEIDWIDRVGAHGLPPDHPLPLLVNRVNKLKVTVWDGLWLRLVDVQRALAARSFGDGRTTIEVVGDAQFADNKGTWTVDDGAVSRRRLRADVRLPVDALGAVYLGGFTFARLVAAGLAEEGSRGGAARADAVFGTALQPWCPENF
jgi:predicted acetyltransferase